jgi:hypothetical protein
MAWPEGKLEFVAGLRGGEEMAFALAFDGAFAVRDRLKCLLNNRRVDQGFKRQQTSFPDALLARNREDSINAARSTTSYLTAR